MKKLIILLLATTLLSMTLVQDDICGTYKSNNEWGGHSLKLQKEGTFVQITSGCVYETQTEGKWKVEKNILELAINKQKNLRGKGNSKSVNRTAKFLIRNDSLFGISERNSISKYDPIFALVRIEQ